MADWYVASGYPIFKGSDASQGARTEFTSIQTDIADKLPAITGNANAVVIVNSTPDALSVIAPANDGVLITSATGVPSISSTIPNATQDNITRTGTVTSGTWNSSLGTAAQASQSAIEDETDEDTYVPPDLVVNSPGVAKLWAKVQSDGTIDASFNLSSMQDNAGAGDWSFIAATDFSTTDFAVVASVVGAGFTINHNSFGIGPSLARMQTYNAAQTLIDAPMHIAMFGDR